MEAIPAQLLLGWTFCLNDGKLLYDVATITDSSAYINTYSQPVPIQRLVYTP